MLACSLPIHQIQDLTCFRVCGTLGQKGAGHVELQSLDAVLGVLDGDHVYGLCRRWGHRPRLADSTHHAGTAAAGVYVAVTGLIYVGSHRDLLVRSVRGVAVRVVGQRVRSTRTRVAHNAKGGVSRSTDTQPPAAVPEIGMGS